MVDQLARPKDRVEVFWFSEQPNAYVKNEDLEKYDATRFLFPNSHFDPEQAHVLYNQYHEQYALVDEVGFDGIMTNEHHTAYWCMKPAANLDAAVSDTIRRSPPSPNNSSVGPKKKAPGWRMALDKGRTPQTQELSDARR